MLRTVWCLVLPLVLFAAEAAAQTPQIDKVRKDVQHIGASGNVTVSTAGGNEYYGSISRIGTDDFSVNEVDLRREIDIRYADVKRVRAGYGNTRNIRGQRIHPRTKLIVSLAVIGGLLALAFGAVLSDHS